MATIINVGNVLSTDNSAAYVKQEANTMPIDCIINSRYEKDRHIYMMGVCSPSTIQTNKNSAYFVQLAQPTLLWVCDWTMARVGKQPIVPNPTPLQDDWVLLDDWWEPAPISLAGADGTTPFYRISGTFVYGHTRPANNTNNNVVFPLSVWLKNVFGRSLPDKFLQQGLTDANVNVGIGG